MKKLLLILSVVLLADMQFTAQTVLPAILPCNETLTLSGSPYIVDNTITVLSGCSLTVNAGVEIKVAPNKFIIVKGKASFLGTAQNPVRIHAKTNQWGIIYLDSADQKAIFNYTIIENATFGPMGSDQNFTPQIAAISADHCSFELNNCTFKNNLKSVYGFHGNNFLVKNCVFDSTNAGENVLLQFADNSEASGNTFYFLKGSGDHIDFDASKNITIKDNYAFGGESDAIDIGQRDSVPCNGVLIANNYLYNMGDKGVTNGEGSTNIKIEYNVIQGCDVGIGAKDHAQVVADHNTLSGNRIGVKAYDHLLGLGGGNITVTNTIIANSIDSTFRKEPTALLTISYSLSDSLLPGPTNSMGNPQFVSSTDLHLTAASPAIDKGDPAFMKDPDGTRSDIGRFYFNKAAGIPSDRDGEQELIYPNPSHGKFTMRLIPNYEINQVAVINVLGQAILKEEFFGNKSEYAFDLSSQPTGIYFVQLVSENDSVIKKLVVY